MRRSTLALIIVLLLGTLGDAVAVEPSQLTPRAELCERRAQLAADDADARVMLAAWCAINNLEAERLALLKEAVRIAPDHASARAALGHEKIGGTWLSGDALMRAKGLVRHKGEWVPAETMYATKGWVRHRGRWMSPAQVKRFDKRQERLRELAKARSDWSQAWEITTERFALKTNVSPLAAQELAAGLEACVAELARVFNLKRQLQRIPVEVYATREEFIAQSAAAGIPIGGNVLGYFYHGGRGSGIRCFHAGSMERTLSVLYHECTHLVINAACGDEVPTWANEGLAVFFEDAERDGARFDLTVIPFERLWHLQEQLKQGEVSLDHLCRLDGPGQYGAQYYPQGWALIYFLLYAEDGKYRPRFLEFYKLLGKQQRMDPIVLFEKGFGVKPDDLRAQWRAFVDGLEPKDADDFAAAAVDSVGMYFDPEKARAFASEALTRAPTAWQAHAAAARVELHCSLYERDPDRAAEQAAAAATAFEQARRLHPRPRKGLSPIDDRLALDHARALTCIGRYDEALVAVDSVLEGNEACADAYACLALIAATADDPQHRDLERAEADLAIADDLGAGHLARYVHALIAAEKGYRDQAAQWLGRAADEDAYGFGRWFYQREQARLCAR
ncbi:MAG TPA: hypothetical protein VEL07_20995 [Planctomycetota bacterium]|nr:hypothetical protein [Planctomycetota bacterium]